MVYRIISLVAAVGLAIPQITPQQNTSSTPALTTIKSTPLPAVVVLGSDSLFDRDSIRTILERDFDLSDRIRVVFLDTVSRSRMTPPMGKSPEYDLFDSFDASYIVRPVRTQTGLRIALYHVPKRSYVRAFTYTLPLLPGDPVIDTAPPLAMQYKARIDLHRAADDLELAITGVRGISATRIVYVHGNYLRMIDSDGASDHTVTNNGEPLSPSWHPTGTSVVYSDLRDAGTQIAQLNLLTGKSTFLTATPRGLNITPVYTPRGDSIVYSTTGPRGTRLVIASARTAAGSNKARQIPLGKDVDRASPSFKRDGKRIAFVASLPSFPQIYTMRMDGTDVRRLVPYVPPRRNDRTAPDWSPDGHYIAYQQQNRKFQIWTIRLRDSLITQVTNSAENEDPSWAPDSRHMVVTSTRGYTKELWILDTKSGRARQLTHSPGARLSAWSPRLR